MAGLTGILDMAKRSMMTQQVAMSVTSHNVSNAATPGYSRQRLNTVTSEPLKESYGMLGTGVLASGVQRLRVGFVDQQIRNTNYNLGMATQQERILGQVEASLNEPSDSGLGSMISNFFNSFQDLSVHPEENASRNAVVQSATAMNDGFHRLTSSLQQLKSDLMPEVQSRVDKINQLTKEIAQTDKNITAIQASGIDANDALDQRDNLIEQLSTLVNIHVMEDSQGSVTIDIGGSLVESRAGATVLKIDARGGTIQIMNDGSPHPVGVSSGELGGILNIYNSVIPSYQSKLDTLAGTIISRVNVLHSAGFGLGTPPPTGNDFFAGADATTIGISAAVSANTNNIAASGDGSPGNNGTALSIAHAEDETLLNAASSTIAQYYNGIVSDVGFKIQSATGTETSQNLVLTQLQNQRDSVSGVSIDEEMVNLIKFQKGFDASAKIISSVNEMYQSILNMV